ncbi:MAG: methionine--tRNA ligase [Patescibacteria group bacterium]
MSKKPFYITTTLPYVNSDPHVGFAMEIIRADVIARHRALTGHEVFFNTGTDEHGVKIYQKAFGEGENTQKFVDRYVEKFKNLKDILGLSQDIHFIRTTDPHHISAAQEFWRRCDKAGYIYKKNYKTKYCTGCELEKTDTELENGRCIIHPTLDLLIIEEENYFFRFSLFGKRLLDLYEKTPDFVVPNSRLNEIRAFVERGLEDFSISRLASKMPWGIAVPNDADHVMYVWFDALVNYISTLGWPNDTANFEKFWANGTPVQYCGKDNLRQQAAMWQAMLMAVGLPNSRHVVIDGFITGEGGLKMSKTLGNTVEPIDVVKEYDTDALRYFVCRELSPFEDGAFSLEKFKEAYNANLANGLGNLASRTLKMVADNTVTIDWKSVEDISNAVYSSALESFNIKAACDEIWKLIQQTDKLIQDGQPFKVVKTDPEKGKEMIQALGKNLYIIARMLEPVLPSTAETIKKLIKEGKTPESPLFMRK